MPILRADGDDASKDGASPEDCSPTEELDYDDAEMERRVQLQERKRKAEQTMQDREDSDRVLFATACSPTEEFAPAVAGATESRLTSATPVPVAEKAVSQVKCRQSRRTARRGEAAVTSSSAQ